MAMTKFRPYDDEELISYLMNFVCGKPFVECHHIRQIDVYGDKKPCEIFDNSSDVNYFFTQLRRKTVRGKKFNRKIAGGGTWKSQEKQRPVFATNKSVIGFMKTFRFKEENSDKSIKWYMKEYCLSDIVLKELREGRQIRHEGYVLCRIKRKVKICSSKNNFQSGEKNVVANQNHNLGSSSSQNQEKISVSWTPSISKSSEDQFQALQENTIDVASYHKEIDAYAKAILESNPPLVPLR